MPFYMEEAEKCIMDNRYSLHPKMSSKAYAGTTFRIPQVMCVSADKKRLIYEKLVFPVLLAMSPLYFV